MTGEPKVLSTGSRSKLTELSERDELRLARVNAVRFQVSRQLLYLRRFRGWSQAKLAREMGTSQSAVARIEGAEENVSVDTIERAVTALKGRFAVSISPAEMHFPALLPWSELIDGGVSSTNQFVLKGIVSLDDDGAHKVAAGWISVEKALTGATTTALLTDATPKVL